MCARAPSDANPRIAGGGNPCAGYCDAADEAPWLVLSAHAACYSIATSAGTYPVNSPQTAGDDSAMPERVPLHPWVMLDGLASCAIGIFCCVVRTVVTVLHMPCDC